MSVVLCYADDKMAIIASDGRVTDINGDIFDEDFNKTRKINENVIIGFAGEANPCKAIADTLTNELAKPLLKNYYVEDVASFIELLFSKYDMTGRTANFIVAGIGKNNKICATNVSTLQESEKSYPSQNSIYYCGLYPEEIVNDTDYFKELLMRQDPREAIKSMIQICAKLSPKVNEKMFCKEVHLS